MSDLDEVVAAILEEDKTQVFEHMLEYDILESTDKDCFLARECETYEFLVHQVADAGILGEATQEVTWEFRWIGEGYGQMFMRTLSPDPIEFTTSILAVEQQYSVALVYDDGDGARRMEAFWIEGEIIGADVPEGFAVSQAVNQMHKSAENIDAYIQGETE